MASLFSYLVFLSFFCINFNLTYSKSQLIRLDEENWSDMLAGEWMVEFYAPWCPACKALLPVWDEFSTWSKDLGVSVAQVDITTSPGLSGRFMVTALPTIFHVVNGEFRRYTGTRDREAFMSYIEDRKWKSVEPISSWKYPSSIQMSIVAYFFKLSQGLRTIHNSLTVEHGLPQWGSYLIFAIVTILLGALLGLVCLVTTAIVFLHPVPLVAFILMPFMLIFIVISMSLFVLYVFLSSFILFFLLVMVCLIDYIWPQKAPIKSKKKETGGGDENWEEMDEVEGEMPEEDLIDDQAAETNTVKKRKARKAD